MSGWLLSARRNQVCEHVVILAIVEAEAELVQIEGQIFLADVVEVANHATL